MAGNIFISYRRDDDPGFTHAINLRLEQEFPDENLFMDVEGHIKPGDDYVAVLTEQVAQCDVLLAIIGERWVDIRDEDGNRRLEKENDFVRIEIASALSLGKRVIPVLVNRAEMPRAGDLPESLKPLARRNGVAIRHTRFKADSQGLINALQDALTLVEVERAAKSFSARLGAAVKRITIGMGAILLLAGGGWVLLRSGAIQGLELGPGRAPAFIAVPDLPSAVANVPAVMTLERNDPAAFNRFRRRFADTAANARDDEVMTLTRNALRKSVKHLLAVSPGDVLLEITETSLAYLQGLQATNPESCVWLSDDNKGARLTSNLAKDLPVPFIREMSVLERIAGTDPHMAIAPMSDEEARPYFEKVLNTLWRQKLKTDLQARERLDPSEFAPYCSLVIAFYRAVLDLPRDDKVNVLRNLYAKAAINADSDLK